MIINKAFRQARQLNVAGRMGLLKVLCLYAIVAVLAPGAWRAEAEMDIPLVQKSIVGVRSYRGNQQEETGTGFVVRTDSSNGYVVTSANLLIPGGTISVTVPSTGAELIATSIVRDDPLDLAILRVNGLRQSPLVFSDTPLDQGDVIWSAGYKAGQTDSVTVSRGSVSRNYVVPTVAGQVHMLMHNAPVSGSELGAPLLNDCGQVAGITISSPGVDAGIAYAMRSSSLMKLLRASAIAVSSAERLCLSAVQQAQQDATLASTDAREAKDEAVRAMSTANELANQVQQVNRVNEALKEQATDAQARAGQAIKQAAQAHEDVAAARLEIDRRATEIMDETQSILKFMEEDRQRKEARMKANLDSQRAEAEQREMIYMALLLLLFLVLFATILLKRKKARRPTAEKPPPKENPRTVLPGSDLTEYVLDGEDERGIRYLLRMTGDLLATSQGAVIGRNPPDSPYVINHSDVSRRHARMRLVQNRLFIEDLGSTNGTTVNGQAIEDKGPVTLANGDQVIFGSVVLRLRSISA